MWQCNSCICGVGLWRPQNCRTACGHSAQGMVWVTLLECNAPLRTPVLVGDHGCVPAHVGTLCTSVHLLEQFVPKNQSPQSHRGRRPPLASLGAHSLFIATVPPPTATKRWFSFEHPPTASSWNLDLLQELVASGTSQTGPTVVAGNNMLKVEKYIFDSCRWGHQDPGNGKLYRKRQCFASNADLSPLCLRCVCCVRHQLAEGTVDSGPRKGTRRSLVAGEYPWAFCVAWADLIKSASGGT